MLLERGTHSHLGRATVSSVAVAHEVAYLQGRAIACLNARDRNLLGQRDLLTAAAYGVRELLFVYGDSPSHGDRSTLTVRRMLEQVQQENVSGLRVGVAAGLRQHLPKWKHAADFVCTQMSFDATVVARRDAHDSTARFMQAWSCRVEVVVLGLVQERD